jgi:NDP-sugar pyrophosphorylase family protein
VAVLAGGLATRLGPLTATLPKALVEVAGRPFAEHQIEWLRSEGAARIVYLIAHRGEMIADALGDGRRWGISLEYVYDGETLLGTGGALRRALPTLGEAFFVLYGDSLLTCDLSSIERTFRSSGRAGLMTVLRNDDRWDRSNVQLENGRIVRYDKVNRTPEMHHVDYGIGILTEASLSDFPEGEAFDLAIVYQRLIATGSLAAVEVSDRFYEIGSPEGLEATRAFLERRLQQARQSS